MTSSTGVAQSKTPWNRADYWVRSGRCDRRMSGQIRVRLQLIGCKRDLAMFNLAIDSKLRSCDLVRLQVDDVVVGGHVRDRAVVIQKKTGRPVQFELTEQTRVSVQDWVECLHPPRNGACSQVASGTAITSRRVSMLES